MAKVDLRKSVKELGTFLTNIKIFGTKVKANDQFIFDRRGAIRITDKSITKRNGEVVKIRGIEDAGSGASMNSMVIARPAAAGNVDASKAMDANTGWVFACIKAIADEISNTEFKVVKVGKDGTHEEIENHELIDFLEAVNDHQTGPEFKHILAAHLELTGNAYLLLSGVTDEKSKPTSMSLLDPSRVKVILNKSVYPFKILRYEFTYDSRKWTFQPHEIIQIKYPDPSNQYLGIGTVQGIAEWVDNDGNATEFLHQFFNNGAQIGQVFETDMAAEDQLQALKDSFNEQHSGVGNAYKAIFLPKGVKKPQNDVEIGDIGLTAIADNNRDKILAGFRVSKTILGTAESDTNRSTAETADYVFAKRTIKPKMQLICSYLNEFLVPRFGDDIFLSFLDPVPDDKVALSTEMKDRVGALPIMTVNEVREKYLGLEAVEGGDKLLAPTAFGPAEKAGTYGSALMLAAKKEKGFKKTVKLGYVPARTNKGRTQFARNLEVRKEMSNKLAENILAALKPMTKKLKDMTDNEYREIVLKDRSERVNSYTRVVKEKIQELNDKQKKEVMSNLSEAIKALKGIDPKKLLNKKAWIQIFIDALTPIANDMFEKEAAQALRLIDKPGLDIVNTPSAQKAIDESMELLSRSYNDTVIDTLQVKLEEGLSKGYGVQKLGELVSDIYEWNNTYAAERVALTESNRISNIAGKIAWQEAGTKEIRWATYGGETACAFCQAMDNKTIAIEENFYDKGDTIEGSGGVTRVNDYSDMGGPPMHPNCRCGIKPVITDSIEASIRQGHNDGPKHEDIGILLDELLIDLEKEQ